MNREIHGTFSDIATHHLYEFIQTKKGTIVHKRSIHLLGRALVPKKGAYETMNEVDVTKLYFHDGWL